MAVYLLNEDSNDYGLSIQITVTNTIVMPGLTAIQKKLNDVDCESIVSMRALNESEHTIERLDHMIHEWIAHFIMMTLK